MALNLNGCKSVPFLILSHMYMQKYMHEVTRTCIQVTHLYIHVSEHYQ